MMDSDADLEALCDLLDDDEDETTEEDPQNKAQDKSCSNTNNAETTSKATTLSDHCAEASKKTSEEAVKESDQPPVSEAELLRQQMAEMQKQMLLMQQKLEKVEKSPKTAAPRSRLVESNFLTQDGANAGGAKTPPRPKNPFEEIKVSNRTTKTYTDGNHYGPGLPKRSGDRKLEGSEKKELLANLRAKDQERQERKDYGIGVGGASVVAQDLRDSSDEEAERDPNNQKYNEYGLQIKRQLKQEQQQRRVAHQEKRQPPAALAPQPKATFDNIQGSQMNLSNKSANQPIKNLLHESHSKLRIANPMLDQQALNLSMVGRKMVPVHRLKNAIINKETEGDWVTIGVIFYKSSQTSKNGNSYTMWKMSDLQGNAGDFKTISVLLFGKAHQAHQKHYPMPLNKVVGLLNSKVLEDRSGKGEVSLSIDNPDRILELGDSVDVGKCQGKRQDGSGCTALVNKHQVEYCTYHVKKAYKSMSGKRSELQSSFSGNSDVRDRIMSKIAPKGEVFAGGQILNQGGGGPTLKGKKSAQQIARDNATLEKLGVTGAAQVRELSNQIAKKRNALHEKLFNDDPAGSTGNKTTLQKVMKKKSVSEDMGLNLLKATPGSLQLLKHYENKDLPKHLVRQSQILTRDEEMALQRKRMADNQKGAKDLLISEKASAPLLARGFSEKSGGGFIDLSSPITGGSSRARAAELLKKKPIAKPNPNCELMSRKRNREESEKKVGAVLNPDEPPEVSEPLIQGAKNRETNDFGDETSNEAKRPRLIRSFTGELIDEAKMAQLKKTKSKRSHLADEAETEEEERYFDRAEKKEAMEDKMVNTLEVKSKVVSCSQCSYTAYTQSDLCKTKGHQVKRFEACKRFFECKKCKKRTFAFDKYPKKSCLNCGGSAWERTGMMRERKGPKLDNEKLLIRGQEQTFVGATVSGDQLNVNSLA